MAASSRIAASVLPAGTKLIAEALFLPVFSDARRRLPAALKPLDEDAGGKMSEFLKHGVIQENPGSADAAFIGEGAVHRLALVSVGPKSRKDLDGIRIAGATIARHLASLKLKRVCVATANVEGHGRGSAIGALIEGMLLGDFRYEEHLSSKNGLLACKAHVVVERARARRSAAKDIRYAEIAAGAANLARTISHQPPNQINPVSLARTAKRLATQHGLRCTVLDEEQMRRRSMGGMLAVGQGSASPPRLITLRTRRRSPRAPVVLVGKAITFDTGGYSLKPANTMLGMKYDKCGGINVLAVMTAVAQLKLRVPVIGVIAAAENMISGAGYRPNDIIRMCSGKTVEITNTDAEGRMVLADALTHAQQTFAPRAMIDLATLTGGAVIALGPYAAAMFCNDDRLAKRLIESGRATHERLWQLPMWDDYDQILKGTDSDLINSGKERAAHCIQGAVFLKQFIEPGTKWAHLDIAATGVTDKDLPYCPQGATGFGVRLLLDYLSGL